MRTFLQSIIILFFLSAFSVGLNGQGWVRRSIPSSSKVFPAQGGNFFQLASNVYKIDPFGERIWRSNIYDESTIDTDSTILALHSVCERPNGHILVAGEVQIKTYSLSGSTYSLKNGYVYIAEFTENGLLVWEKSINFGTTNGHDVIRKILPLNDGYLLYGYADHSVTISSDAITEMLLLKINLHF